MHELGIRGPLRNFGALCRLLGLAGLVRRERIEIVHTFLFDADVYGMLAARLGFPRAVVTTRRALKKHKPHHIRGYSWTNWLVGRIVPNSEEVAAFTAENERGARRKITVIPNGVDVARYAAGDAAAFRARLGVPEDARLVGAVGTIKPVKGQSDLLAAMAPLLERDPKLHLVLAGAAGSEYGQGLRMRAEAREFGDRVHFPGPVDEVPDLLAALELYVLPSHSEGMSNALLEAMAAGRLIVATRVGGNAECLEGGAAGALVPAGEVELLRAEITSLLEGGPRCAALRLRAQSRARSEYTLDALVSRTEALYRELLKGRSADGAAR